MAVKFDLKFHMCNPRAALIGVVVAGSAVRLAQAGFVTYGNTGAAAWFQSVETHSTINFVGYPMFTPITEQYSSIGAHFVDTEGNWTIQEDVPISYPQDGYGLWGRVLVEIEFDTPLAAFASHFPGQAQFSFYSASQLLFVSALMGGSGVNRFAGFTSDIAFDRVLIQGGPPDQFGNPDEVFFDNFYFTSVPAPSALALLVCGGLWPSGRRRK